MITLKRSVERQPEDSNIMLTYGLRVERHYFSTKTIRDFDKYLLLNYCTGY